LFSHTETPAVNYFLSGMGVECCYLPLYQNKLPVNLMQWFVAKGHNQSRDLTAGFTSFEVTKATMTVTFYDQVSVLMILLVY